MPLNEKLFNDAINLASLWLSDSQAETVDEYRDQVEASVQHIYHALTAVRERIMAGEL